MSFGLLFHHFHNEKHIKTQGSITEKDFRNLLNFVQKEYNLLSAEMWLDLQSKNRLGKQDVCITFDDALKSQYVVAYPVLQEYSIKAFWFLHTSFLEDRYDKLEIFRDFRHRSFDDIEDFYIDFFKYLETKDLYSLKYSQIINEIDFKSYLKNFELYSYNDRKFRYIRDYMLSFKEYELIMFQMMKKKNYQLEKHLKELWLNQDEIREIHNSGHFIGLHSHNHPTSLEKFSFAKQKNEFTKNKEILEKIIQDNVYFASFPCGRYNLDTLKVLKDLSIKISFAADMDEKHFPNGVINRKDHALVMKELNI